MKFSAERKALAAALKAATVPAASGHLAILGGLRLEATGSSLSVTGTNLDLTVATDIEAAVDKPGVVVLPGRLLAALVDKAAAEDVTITVAKEQATIEAGPTVATLRTLRTDDWPAVTTADGDHFELTGNDVDRLGCVLHAVLTDPKKVASHPERAGVHFIDNRAEATDSYRLAIAQLGCAGMPDKVVPVDVVSRVVRASPAGLTITFDSRLVTFDSADARTTWTSTLIPANYPKVESLVRKESAHKLTVHRQSLADALGRVRLLADGDLTHPVDLVPDGNAVQLVASSIDVGEISDEVAVTGDWSERLRFHDRYLADLLANHDGDEITFEIEDALKPVIARTEDWRLLLLLMPVRIPVAA